MKKLSEKHKKNISLAMKGKHSSPKTQFKKGIYQGYGFKKGQSAWNKGIKCPQLQGKNSPNWKGGVTPERKIAYFSKKYQDWRTSVFESDNYTCQKCNEVGYVEAHHVKRWADFPKLRYLLSNGQTLCKECHNKTKGRRVLL